MKKKFLVVVMLMAVIMTAVMLGGCSTQKMSLAFMQSVDGEVEYVNVNISKYEGKMLSDLLVGEKSLGAVLDGNSESPYLVEIKNLKPQGRQYVAIFTSDESKKNTYEGAKEPIVLDNVTYYESGVGIKDLSVNKDIKYLFVIIQY